MQLKRFIFSLTAMLALLIGVHQPLSAAKKANKKNRSEKHHKHSFSSSSSRHHKKKKCCYHDRIECKLNNVLKAEKELINNLIGCDVLICELPYTISKPGTYRITCDLAFDPATPDQTAITIAASDVVLDLGTNRIYQVSGNLQPATGVFVSPNTTNITITGETTGKRGTIQGFEGWGINCPGPNDFLGGNIKIENIIVEECGSDARVDGVFYVDGGIQVGTFTFGTPPVKPISEVLVSNVLALKNKNIGIGLYVTDTVIVQDCIVDGTYSEAPTYLLIGLDIENPVQDADPMPYTKNAQILRTSVTNTHCHTIASYVSVKRSHVVEKSKL